MKTKNTITYYCFNKACNASVYFSDTIKVDELPLTLANLTADHYCGLCHKQTVSIVDIEIKQAVNPIEPQPYKVLQY